MKIEYYSGRILEEIGKYALQFQINYIKLIKGTDIQFVEKMDL